MAKRSKIFISSNSDKYFISITGFYTIVEQEIYEQLVRELLFLNCDIQFSKNSDDFVRKYNENLFLPINKYGILEKNKKMRRILRELVKKYYHVDSNFYFLTREGAFDKNSLYCSWASITLENDKIIIENTEKKYILNYNLKNCEMKIENYL